MPHIDDQRQIAIRHHVDRPRSTGELAFQIADALEGYIFGRDLNFQTLAECLGALESAKAEFIEHVHKPYEATKAAESRNAFYDSMRRLPPKRNLPA